MYSSPALTPGIPQYLIINMINNPNGHRISNKDHYDPRLDDFGDYTGWVVLNLLTLCDYSPCPTHINTIVSKPLEPDYVSHCPYFGWVNPKTIQRTYKKTTQWASAITTYPMKRHLKSRFPALNILRHCEPVATDTVMSDTPAVNSGV